ncbi:uncharacterized protein LOC116770247 [Danaus plexippus]|nr:uncharacterized protein LOC116770247 [Danaus plexippus]
MWYSNILGYLRSESIEMLEYAKCGDSTISMIPTAIWTAGSAALAQRLISALFRRFMFRRIPLWEIILQRLLFIWMVIYSIHFWLIVVNVIKLLIEYCYQTNSGVMTSEELEQQYLMQQWTVWMVSVMPAVLFAHTRNKDTTPPPIIWITTSPWQRREMGAYGYYLDRPFSSLEPPSTTVQQRALTLRKAFSDSKTIIKEPPRKRRYSKSV